MPVIIKNLVVNAEIGSEERRNAVSPQKVSKEERNRMKKIREEELTERLLQILEDQKER